MQQIKDKYVKLDQHEHILQRPGMYIGSVDPDSYSTWVFEKGQMQKRDITIIPGLYKIYDEIIVNAIDHITRLKIAKEKNDEVNLVKKIKIDINQETGEISVWNDGDGIEVVLHPEHNVYIPELIFGNLLTSTNYNAKEEKIIGGQNGIGAKACNIFSTSFKIETVDYARKKCYEQVWSNNMYDKSEPSIKRCTTKPYTCITFTPDYSRFGIKGLNKDIYGLMVKRVYDICALTDNDVSVHFNGEKLDYKNFEKYVNLFIGEGIKTVHEKINDRWEIIACFNEDGFDQISFVNGIWTIRGGKHVDYITNQITNKLIESINSKKKSKVDIKPNFIKNHLLLFIKCIVTNPTFDSQTKDLLTTPISKFGSKGELSDKFFEKLYKSEIVDKAILLGDVNAQRAMKKSDGRKSNKIHGLVKLDDAIQAGSKNSIQCTLILTEGDSAKSTALAGISEVGGRKFYGIFPLRGKLLNVKDVSVTKLLENEEIKAIKQIVGLESGKVYNTLESLRYGKIMLMTDQDTDGTHIRGLLMNLFQTLWPSLLDKGFIVSLLTPIIKVSQGSKTISFYNTIDYDKWHEENPKGWKVKYYKGLGTSTDEEALSYFKNMRLVKYMYQGDVDDNAFDLAFNKKRADDRKNWLGTYNSNSNINYQKETSEITYKDFVDKELIQFSIKDVKRSIPSMIDGLKPSQRKILYCCFKRNLTTETKVAQLSGYVSEHSAYLHGEVSLQGAIVNLAQNFVGSNNLNILKPNGQFGTRTHGGKDASQPRYIFTQLSNLTHDVYKKEDECLLDYLKEDAMSIEPEYYVPIIPMVLVNGAIGIGTGYSTNIPTYNPLDLINVCKDMVAQEGKIKKLAIKPWARGFKGTIAKGDQPNTFTCSGVYKYINSTTVEILELPIGMWTEDYKAFIDDYTQKNPTILKDYDALYTTQTPHFILYFAKEDQFDEKTFKMTTKISLNNMHLFDENDVIRKYTNVKEILESFYKVRIGFYEKRKIAMIKRLEEDKNEADEKARFIEYVIAKKIILLNAKIADLEAVLEKFEFKLINGTYNYLLHMPIQSLTAERVQDLRKEAENLARKLEEYLGMKIQDMWIKELDELYQKYSNDLEKYLADMEKKSHKKK